MLEQLIQQEQILIPFFIGIMISLIFWFIIGILLCIWVYRDAESRSMNGALWLIIVLIANFVGLIVYLIVREDKRVPDATQSPTRWQTRYCPNCGQAVSAEAKYCRNCGKALGG